MDNTYLGWHVLYVKTQHEKKVDLLLKQSKLDSFLPTVKTVRQWRDRKKKVTIPLFPSYIFLNIHSRKEFYEALNVHGVFNYVRFGKKYATLRNDEISRIKGFLNLEGISEIDTISGVPCKGELMTINHGQLDGFDCEVINTNNKNKVFVRIDSLNRNITAVVPSNFLSKRIA